LLGVFGKNGTSRHYEEAKYCDEKVICTWNGKGTGYVGSSHYVYHPWSFAIYVQGTIAFRPSLEARQIGFAFLVGRLVNACLVDLCYVTWYFQ
jgi:hypothetical protein